MHRTEAIFGSPLRILDRGIRGGLGPGRLGAVVAPPGLGKSALLVQLGLDALLRDRAVLHLAAGPSVDHVAALYDAAFDELAGRVALADGPGVRAAMARRRLIWSVPQGALAAEGARALDDAIAAFHTHLRLDPATLLVDGFVAPGAEALAIAERMKRSAARAGAELWIAARPPWPAGASGAVVDVAIALQPRGPHVGLRLLAPARGGAQGGADLPLVLDGGALRVAPGAAPSTAAPGGPGSPIDPCDCTLLATGSPGAEEEFGACAERWGVAEVNFTFAGRGELARTRGLRELTEDELRLGEVSPAYVKAHLHRTFGAPAGRVLQAIWHQVSTAGEVFAVGALLPDGTAHGGTGWAVELARHWGKPAHLFDLERSAWYAWDGRGWAAEPPPSIAHDRFAGAGTLHLGGAGRNAIRELFERSFGAAPR